MACLRLLLYHVEEDILGLLHKTLNCSWSEEVLMDSWEDKERLKALQVIETCLSKSTILIALEFFKSLEELIIHLLWL